MPIREGDVQDAEELANVVNEYLHWREVNPQIKGGENYLKRFVACNSESPHIPRTSLDRYGEIAYRTAYNPDYATPWDKLSTLTKRKYKAMAKAILTQAGADYVE
jgi:hypothetical protein